MPLAEDLLFPDKEKEKRRHKLKRLVQGPNSFFMDVKCPECYQITLVFSHTQTVRVCIYFKVSFLQARFLTSKF